MSVEKGAKGFQVWWRCWLLPILRKQTNKRGPGSSTPANAQMMLKLAPNVVAVIRSEQGQQHIEAL